ncbi:hypothetical protein L0Z22_16275 [Burkholderia cepacia]|nr:MULTISPECIES: hypothetical protein [Burkholderia]UQO34027.1 hypothetical protein L0Z22_16275 [Burkholderia cepacia]UQO47481.1 hypothetical protein L0Z05_00775 [Burkholderia cepacia]UQP08277.1 hypothetical protein L0Z01_31575 [Burkholderia cepacia]
MNRSAATRGARLADDAGVQFAHAIEEGLPLPASSAFGGHMSLDDVLASVRDAARRRRYWGTDRATRSPARRDAGDIFTRMILTFNLYPDENSAIPIPACGRPR